MTDEPKLQETLKMLQLKLSAHLGRRLTHTDLACIADVGNRSIGEWMRGATAPPGMLALLRLLSALPPEELASILNGWQPQDIQNKLGPQQQIGA
jgi:hypothetical protein